MDTTTARNYGLLTDLDKLAGFVKGVLERKLWVGFDVETGYTGPDRQSGSLLIDWDKQFVCGFSISHDPNFGRYVPLRHDDADNVNEALAWEIMQPLLTRGRLAIHHMKFERRNVIKMAGIVLGSDGGEVIDTMLDSYVLSEFALEGALRASHGLKDLTKILFDYDQPHIQTLFPGYTDKQMRALRFNTLKLTTEVVNYCCEDAAWALALLRGIDPKARSERPTMHRIEHEISDIMADVETKGVEVDWPAMEAALADSQRFVPRITQAARDGLARLAGQDLKDLNLGSPKQLQELLYKDIGLTTTRMTKSAKDGTPQWQKMSTDAIAMEGLSQKHPEIRKLLDLREVQNMARRLDKWLKQYRYASDGRIHANYNQVVVGSGRFSANDPAIQQLPKEWRWSTYMDTDCWDDEVWRSVTAGDLVPEEPVAAEVEAAKDTAKEEPEDAADVDRMDVGDSDPHDAALDSEDAVLDEALASPVHGNGIDYWTGNFRMFVIAAPDTYLLTFDYSQVELRVLAGVTQEPALLRAFANGVDVHSMTAAMMLHEKPEDVSKKDRQTGKMLNFALLYQMGEQSMAERLGITLEEAKKLFQQYFSAFTRIGTWQDLATAKGKRLGYAETPFGRKVTVWELNSSNRAVYAKGVRVLTNAPIQGGAADYMKMAMIRVTKKLKDLGWWMKDCTIIMNQHDSLTFEVSNRLNPAEVRSILEPCVVFPVPRFPVIVAEWELGQTWGGSDAWHDGMYPVWDEQREIWHLVKPESTEPAAEPVQKVVEVPEAQDAPQSAVEAPVTAADDSVGAGMVEVVVDRPPTRAALQGLLAFVAGHPGEDETWLVTPVGRFRVGKSGIGMTEQPKIAMLLPGVHLNVTLGSADLAALSSNLTM